MADPFTTKPVAVEPLAVDLREAARRLGVSPRTVATMVAERKIESFTIGRRRLVPVAALSAYVAKALRWS